jgi:uncharacterized protein YuzB (UPF0349 family)
MRCESVHEPIFQCNFNLDVIDFRCLCFVIIVVLSQFNEVDDTNITGEKCFLSEKSIKC